MQVQSLGQEDPLENKMQPTPVFLPGGFHGQRSLAGSVLEVTKESDTIEQLNNKFAHLPWGKALLSILKIIK